MQANYEDAMAVIAGQPQQQKLTEETKKHMEQVYKEMYAGLVMVQWADGKKELGQTLYAGMEQMKAYLNTKGDNGATEYLRQIQATHNVQVAKQAMTDPNREQKFDCPDEMRGEYKAKANYQVNVNMTELNKIIAAYQELDKDNRKDDDKRAPEFQPREQVAQTKTAPQNAKPVQPTRNAHIQDAADNRGQSNLIQERKMDEAKKKVEMFRQRQQMIIMQYWQQQNQKAA